MGLQQILHTVLARESVAGHSADRSNVWSRTELIPKPTADEAVH